MSKIARYGPTGVLRGGCNGKPVGTKGRARPSIETRLEELC